MKNMKCIKGYTADKKEILSIVIPVYNEEKTVKEIIKRVKRLKLPLEKEIIVIDDGSSDKSFDIIKKIKGIKIIKHTKNKGKGAAIKTSLKYLSGEILVIQDADLELNPEEIEKIIGPIIKKKACVVYGSRSPVISDIGKTDRNPLFYIGGIVVTAITNFLYGTKLTDEPCGFKAFRTDIIKEIVIKEDRFEWEPEVTAKISKKGIKIHEVAITPNNSRTIKEGKKLRRRDGLKAIWTLIKYRFKN